MQIANHAGPTSLEKSQTPSGTKHTGQIVIVDIPLINVYFHPQDEVCE